MEPLAAMMAEMMGVNPGLALSAMRQSGIDIHNYGQERTKSQIIKAHEAGLRRMMQMLNARGMSILSTSYNEHVKPASDFPAPPALGDCTPIAVRDLQQGTTHRGRVLRGILVVDANHMGSVHTVLEDEAGDCVKVISAALHQVGLHQSHELSPQHIVQDSSCGTHTREQPSLLITCL
eukprot:GHUV01041384.1.p1 GENE.GHUV01041384.1~~GHUV01041384.1.p1  ORF type:complete len:178 (+),score=29.67 GHUV01041384.1:302-835(+)